MPRTLRTVLLAAAAAAALGAGCARTPTGEAQTPPGSLPVDSAMVAGATDLAGDLVGTGAAALAGAAVWDSLPVAQWMVLAATSPEEQARADGAAASGAYLGDPVRVARLQPGDEPGTAAFSAAADVGTAFETEVLHRFDGSAGRLDLTFAGAPAGEGRRMPSLLQVSFSLGTTPGGVVVAVGDPAGDPSELARADLPAAGPALAHRYGVRYAPGQVVVLFDGAPVVEATARLGGGPMTATITATAPAETRAYLLRWTLDLED